jgi:hypothetical protein
LTVLALIAPLHPAAGEPRGGRDDTWSLCARTAAETEAREGLPPHLLSAIAKVESGRWLAAERSVRAWPWTVTAGDQGRFFETMDQAVAAVLALRASGRRNIDVGCMQINLLHHPEAFENLWDAFDPARNVGYAAALLQRLNGEARSWPKAVAYYHSRTPRFNRPYRRKVFRAWHEEFRRAGQSIPITMAAAMATGMATGMTDVMAEVMADAARDDQGDAPQEGSGEDPADKLASDTADAPVSSDALGTAAKLDRTDAETLLASFRIEADEAPPALGQVQLGAFRVAENASSVWAKVLQENAGLLGDFQPRVDVVERGELGTLHLLRVSPIMNVKLAQSICAELRHRAVDCMVVEPPRRWSRYLSAESKLLAPAPVRLRVFRSHETGPHPRPATPGHP